MVIALFWSFSDEDEDGDRITVRSDDEQLAMIQDVSLLMLALEKIIISAILVSTIFQDVYLTVCIFQVVSFQYFNMYSTHCGSEPLIIFPRIGKSAMKRNKMGLKVSLDLLSIVTHINIGAMLYFSMDSIK